MQTLGFVIIINDAVMIREQKNYSNLNRQGLKYKLYYYNVVYVKDENSMKTWLMCVLNICFLPQHLVYFE